MIRKVKYNEEFKLLAVKRVLNKKEGLRSVCYELGLNKSQLQKWIRYYYYYGHEGLRCRDKNSFYSVHFKLKVLKEIEKRGLSFTSAALEQGISSSSTIVNWYKKHQEQGKLGLEPVRKGTPRIMTIKNQRNDLKSH
jgi:transposase